MLSFGVFVLNPSYARYAGAWYAPQAHQVLLDTDRAPFLVTNDDAMVYARVKRLVELHGDGKQVVAGPDAPEVYFLAQTPSAGGTLFEFFAQSPSDYGDVSAKWTAARVIVINHRPRFSASLPDGFLNDLRQKFPESERAGRFEVRWR